MKTSLIFLTSVFLFSAVACSSSAGGDAHNGLTPSEGVSELSLQHAWHPDNMALGSSRITMKGGQVIYMQRFQEYINILFTGLDGAVSKTLRVNRGKGPGELLFPLNIGVGDDRIYISDSGTWSTTAYDLEGDYIDSFPMTEETGYIFLSDVQGSSMAFNSFNQTMLGIMDLETGVITKRIPFEKAGFPEPGEPYIGCSIAMDPYSDKIFVGRTDPPYRIEVYGPELDLLKTYYKKTDYDIMPAEWYGSPGGNMDMQGDFLISSIVVDEKYIYAPSHEMSVLFENKLDVKPIRGSICVFDKNTGKYMWELTSDMLKKYKGTLTVLGADRDHITVLVNSLDKNLNDIINKENATASITDPEFDLTQGILVFENPVYK